jgi:hypothetical protein
LEVVAAACGASNSSTQVINTNPSFTGRGPVDGQGFGSHKKERQEVYHDEDTAQLGEHEAHGTSAATAR